MTELEPLAMELGVSAEVLSWLGVTRNERAWLIPERNAKGEIIGHAKRYDDGKKGCVCGSKRGLTMAWPIDADAGKSPDDPILIVEGMSDCVAGECLDFTTIGRPSATGGIEHLCELLRDRHVCIIGENDSGAGKTGAQKVAGALVGICACVRLIFPPAGCKDLREWYTAPEGCTREELLSAIRAAESMNPTPTTSAVKSERQREPSQAEQLVRLALELYRFGRTEADEPFAVARGGPNLALMFRGSRDALRSTLAREYRRREGTTPNASSLADALTALQGESLETETESVALRVAEHEGSVVIDVGDSTGRAIVVRPGSWEVLDVSPVLFRRTALTGMLPVPKHGGKLDELRALLNVGSDAWALLRGWLVAGLLPSIPHPILMLGGEQGAGKSTAARMLVGLIDPSPAPLRSEPRDAEAWAMVAAGSWAVAVDNVSGIPGWWSDALCRTVTGDGWVRRRLYSDSDLSVLSFRRVVALTSIDAGALRGDLGDRLLLIDLEPIHVECRRSESELNRRYTERQPFIMGALLDLLAEVLARLPNVNLRESPRMADFARILAAIDDVDGVEGGGAIVLYQFQSGRIASDVIEADCVASGVVQLVESCGDWRGTAGELLTKLTPQPPDRLPSGWPRNPRAMSARLKRLIPTLRQIGLDVKHDRAATRDRSRLYTIRKVEQSTVQTVQPSHDDPGAIQGGDSRRTVLDSCVRSDDSNRPAPPAILPGVSDGLDGSDGDAHLLSNHGLMR